MKCIPLPQNKVENTIRAMLQVRANYLGLSSAQLCRAICNDAITDKEHRNIIVIIAVDNNEVAGYVITTVGNSNYLLRFACRHPLIFSQSILRKIHKKILSSVEKSRKKKNSINKVMLDYNLPFIAADSSKSWTELNPETAKIIHIGVRQEFRGRGVAVELYHYLYNFLLHLGVNRIDANIDKSNIASIRMHHNAGWTISTNGSHLFATIDLPHEN